MLSCIIYLVWYISGEPSLSEAVVRPARQSSLLLGEAGRQGAAGYETLFFYTSGGGSVVESGFIESGSGSSISSVSGSRVLITKNLRKRYSWNFFFHLKKNEICLSLGLHTGRPATETFNPQTEHPALQKMKFINFFLFLWVIFAVLDPDCESGSGYRFRDPIESGSTTLGGGMWGCVLPK